MGVKSDIATSVFLICIVVGVGVGIYSYFIGFPSASYDVRKAKQWLWKARASTDLEVMADYIQKGLNEIEDRHGNPCWWYATAETDFDVIKSVLQENINSAREIAATEEKGSYGYQRAIDNIEEAVIEVNMHLSATMDWITWKSVLSVFCFVIWCIVLVVSFLALIYSSIHRKETNHVF